MPVDMKETIAEAARTLLMEKRKKKLTVKDIVDECSITRQAFYYHFEDIPELFRWIIERDTEKLLKSSQALEDPEQRLRYFFLEAINALPYVKRSMQSSYRDELGASADGEYIPPLRAGHRGGRPLPQLHAAGGQADNALSLQRHPGTAAGVDGRGHKEPGRDSPPGLSADDGQDLAA